MESCNVGRSVGTIANKPRISLKSYTSINHLSEDVSGADFDTTEDQLPYNS